MFLNKEHKVSFDINKYVFSYIKNLILFSFSSSGREIYISLNFIPKTKY